MTPQQSNIVRNHLGLLGRTRAQIPFLFVPVSKSGAPLLYTDPEEIDASVYREIVLSAIDPRAVRGVIMRQDDGLFRFVVQRDTVQERILVFLQSVEDGMAGALPNIQNSTVDIES